MSDHRGWIDLIPFYCSGEISEDERAGLEAHLAACPACRADVEFWRSVASEVKAQAGRTAPGPAPIENALARIAPSLRPKKASRIRFAADLLRGQAAILKTEIWISTAILLGICLALSLIEKNPDVIRLIAPVVAAVGLAVVGGPKNDPGFELSRATPVSQGKILLARATLVFGFNLALAVAAGAVIRLVLPEEILPDMIRDGLGPMSFLSALALLLSLWIGTANAVGAAALIWILRIIPAGFFRMIGESFGAPGLGAASSVYRSFWQKPALLIALAVILAAAAAWRADRLGLGRTMSWRNE